MLRGNTAFSTFVDTFLLEVFIIGCNPQPGNLADWLLIYVNFPLFTML
jgi:hypothetical protein